MTSSRLERSSRVRPAAAYVPATIAGRMMLWGWLAPDWKEPTKPWTFHPITEKGDYNQFYHGTGIGDKTNYFLVGQNRQAEALQVADYDRGRTLAEGLGFLKKGTSFKPDPPNAPAIKAQFRLDGEG